MLLAMMFSCQPVSEDVDSGNSNSNNTSQGGNTGGDNTGNQNGGNTGGGNNEEDKPANPQTLTLQQIINDTNAGEEIDLSKYKDVTNYTATVNKALTIKNGSLNNAKLIVTAENVKLEKLEKVSVSTSSRLTINNSKLSDLLIGTSGETSRSGTLSTEMSLAMASITGCEIENVELIGFNSQLNITDVKTKINDIIISTKAKIILEAGSYEGMKDPTVTDDGELTRIDMTKEKELSVLSIYSNPKKAEYQIGEELDVTGLVVMGTYTASIEVFKSGGWKGEAVDSVTKWENEKDYTVTCEDFGTAGVKIVTITSNIDTKVKCNFYVYVKDPQNTEIKEPEITEIELRELGTPKTLYRVGEKLDLSCYQVVGTYNDLEINLAYTSEPANGTTLTTVGETTVTLYYNGEKVAEFPITVENAFLVEFYDGIDNSKPLYTQKVTAGERPSRPSDPVREDYTFTEWYYDEACSEPATYVFLERAEKDIQLYAGWVKNIYAHDITIKVINLPTEVKALSIWGTLNNHKLANIMANKDIYIVDVINGTAEFYFEKMNIVRSLWCQFVPMTSKDMAMNDSTWWQTAFSGSGFYSYAENNLVYDGLVNKTTLTLNVKAVYGDVSTVFEKRFNTEDYMNAFQVSVGECKYKIFYEGFDVEETTYNNNMTSFDDDYDVVLSAPSRYGYTFVGWYETADFSGKPITGWNAGEKKADVTLYAKWEKEEEPVITFNANGGSGTMEEQSVPKGILIGLKENTFTAPDGYLFSHWNTQADGNGISYYDSIKITKDTTLYAQWLKDVPVTGVYSYKLNLDEIEFVWGPRFSVLLLTDEQVKASKEYGKFHFSSKAYQLYSYQDMVIDVTLYADGNNDYAVYGTNPVDNEYQYYTGVATTVTNTTFEVFVDMSKIVKTELKAFSEMDGINEQEFVTESMPVNLTGYKPYVIALGTQAKDPDNYAMTGWDTDVMKMTAGATFPTDLRYDAPRITTLSDMKYVCSNFGNFPITFTDGIATAEIVYSLENATWEQEVLNGIQFGVCIDEVWSVKFTGANIYSFNTEATLTLGADANNEVYADILTDGTTYVLTIDANAGTVKITPKGADYDNVATQEVEASDLVDTITGLSAGVYKLTVTGIMDSDILAAVKTAMQSKKDVEIALDLGGTTGLTEIPDSAFSGCNLTSIVIPEGVTSIGEYALSCLSDSVTIPSTVTFIDYEAFGAEYSDLKAVYISDLTAWCNMEFGGTFKSNPIEFGAKLYLNNNLVTDLVIPDGVTSIGSEAFAKYQYLTSVTIPDSVETIGWGSFSGCDNLTKVTLGNGVTNIRTGAFSSCSSLKNIAIPDNIVSIEQGAFSGCDNLGYNKYDNGLYLGNSGNSYLVLTKVTDTSITSCEIADTTKIIVDSVFQQCINLESIAIPDSVTTIGSGAFVNCPNLANITIGKGLSSIGSQAFAYNTKAVFNIDENNANYSSSTDGKMLLSKDQTTLLAYPSAEGDITIPESVTKIEIFVFSGYSSRLTSVTFAGTGTWYYTENSNYTDGTEIDVTNPAMNATYLADWDTYEYYNKYWYKK